MARTKLEELLELSGEILAKREELALLEARAEALLGETVPTKETKAPRERRGPAPKPKAPRPRPSPEAEGATAAAPRAQASKPVAAKAAPARPAAAPSPAPADTEEEGEADAKLSKAWTVAAVREFLEGIGSSRAGFLRRIAAAGGMEQADKIFGRGVKLGPVANGFRSQARVRGFVSPLTIRDGVAELDERFAAAIRNEA